MEKCKHIEFHASQKGLILVGHFLYLIYAT